MNTNCVNCGAPIDSDAEKYPYCGTSYFDLTAIDFTRHEPIALRLRLPNGRHGFTQIAMLAMPEMDTITYEPQYLYADGLRYCTGYDANMAINFRAVVGKSGDLFHVWEVKK